MTTKRLVAHLLIILLIVILFLVILGLISPKEAMAPTDSSTFQGPPSGEFSGFKGPTSSPPYGGTE